MQEPFTDTETHTTRAMMEALLRPLAALIDRSHGATDARSKKSARARCNGAGIVQEQDDGINLGGNGGPHPDMARNVIKLNELLNQQSGRGRLRRLHRDAHISRVVLELAGNVLAVLHRGCVRDGTAAFVCCVTGP